MIFISYQHEDIDFVGDIAQTLKDAYGAKNVFFDEWSIKPGETIVNKMNTGIEECKFFLFFITHNSLQSNMVNLEWTSALMKRSKEDMEFIPIRAENVDVPAILRGIKYLDLSSNGIEATKIQIREIIEERETNNRYPTFKNLVAYGLKVNEKEIRFYITVKIFGEPNGKFVLATKLDNTQAKVIRRNGGPIIKNYGTVVTEDGQKLNGFFVEIPEGIKKGFKVEISFIRNSTYAATVGLYHITSESNNESALKAVPTTLIHNENEVLTF